MRLMVAALCLSCSVLATPVMAQNGDADAERARAFCEGAWQGLGYGSYSACIDDYLATQGGGGGGDGGGGGGGGGTPITVYPGGDPGDFDCSARSRLCN